MRNERLDCMRLLSALMVVMNHCTVYGWWWIEPLTRCCVPSFLVLSGYFLFDEERSTFDRRLTKTLRQTAWITAYSTAVFLVIELLKIRFCGAQPITWEGIRLWLVYNHFPFGRHLWYMGAYLYFLALAWAFNRIGWARLLMWLMPVCFALNLALGKYSMALFGTWHVDFVTRNYWGMALPFFMLGAWIKRHRTWFEKPAVVGALPYILVASLALSVGEKVWLQLHGWCVIQVGDVYLSTIPLTLAYFLVFLLCQGLPAPRWMARIGANYALHIYIWHFLVKEFVRVALVAAMPERGFHVWMTYGGYLVFVATICVVWIVRRIARRLRGGTAFSG